MAKGLAGIGLTYLVLSRSGKIGRRKWSGASNDQCSEHARGELGKIKADGGSLHGGRLLSMVACGIPTQSGRGFRFDPGYRSDLMSATIPR